MKSTHFFLLVSNGKTFKKSKKMSRSQMKNGKILLNRTMYMINYGTCLAESPHYKRKMNGRLNT